MPQGGSDAYQTLPYRTLTERIALVFLAWSTRAYQSADLGLNLGQNTITNHYHRGEGLTIDLGVGGHAVGWVTVARVM